MTPVLAIASTVRGLDLSYRSALAHHRALGFSRFYLFVDDPSEREDLARMLGDLGGAGLELIPRDAAHDAKAASSPLYGDPQLPYARCVVTRQRINLAMVVELARRDGVDWLLHIDADELLAPPLGRELPEWLAERGPGYDELFFPNLEAVPQREEYDDPFVEVRTFKRSPYHLRKAQLDRLRYKHERQQFYVAYASGKSMFRPATIEPGAVPRSVHHFGPDLYAERVLIQDQLDGPTVLHYPMVGFMSFVRRVSGFNLDRVNQYEVLSDNPNNLFRQARRALTEYGLSELRRFYRQWVLYADEAELDQLRRWGALHELEPERWPRPAPPLPSAGAE
ncbi:hypothetical protein ENSA5_23340 [Enhygromyxa salina]|uniref:Glycosyl transferase family 2 n=1 Tax=Enhygromyxa salina TaxID=215803 RepID=A0A2S9YBB0_9BACT|nr:glycosyltransferase family 2 protein [Enhygromyxa salina]PRQ02407.1 hypothetical protein ENSA5_23340 [Enhygromyxa salina]